MTALWTVTATWRIEGLDGLTVDGGTTSRHAHREEATAARQRLEGGIGVPTDAVDVEITIAPPWHPDQAAGAVIPERVLSAGRAGLARARQALAGASAPRGAA